MKNYIKTIYKSIYSKEWYEEICNSNSLKSAILYIILLISFLSLITSAFNSKNILDIAPIMRERIVSAFPEDLEVVVASGTLSMNKPSPYIVEARGFFDEEGSPENIIVIDTENEGSVEVLKSYDTAFLITKNSIFNQKSSGGQITINQLQNFPDMTINRAWINTTTLRMLELFWIIPIALFIFYFVHGFIFTLIISLILALFVWGIIRLLLKKIDINYRKSYIVTLYGSTLPLILASLGDIFDLKSLGNMTTFSVVLFITIFYVFYKKDMKKDIENVENTESAENTENIKE